MSQCQDEQAQSKIHLTGSRRVFAAQSCLPSSSSSVTTRGATAHNWPHSSSPLRGRHPPLRVWQPLVFIFTFYQSCHACHLGNCKVRLTKLTPLFFCLPLSLSTAQTSSVRGSTVQSTLSRMNASVHNRLLALSLLSFHLKHLARRRLQLSKIIARTFARNCQSEISQLFCPFNILPQILNWSCWRLHFARLPLLLLLLSGVKKRVTPSPLALRWRAVSRDRGSSRTSRTRTAHLSSPIALHLWVLYLWFAPQSGCEQCAGSVLLVPQCHLLTEKKPPPRVWTLRCAVGHFSPSVVFFKHLPAKWVLLIFYMLLRKVNSDFISCLEVRKTIKHQNKEKQGV